MIPQDISLLQQSEAWQAVVEVLNKYKPNFLLGPGTGIECAVRAITELAEKEVK